LKRESSISTLVRSKFYVQPPCRVKLRFPWGVFEALKRRRRFFTRQTELLCFGSSDHFSPVRRDKELYAFRLSVWRKILEVVEMNERVAKNSLHLDLLPLN
jgi:hypothetical protein